MIKEDKPPDVTIIRNIWSDLRGFVTSALGVAVDRTGGSVIVMRGILYPLGKY
jgi:hypothetical protein